MSAQRRGVNGLVEQHHGNDNAPAIKSQRRQRPLGTLNSGVDKEERKRVLNVLAQRRYRKRKKERQAELEQTTRVTSICKTGDNGSTRDIAILTGSSSNDSGSDGQLATTELSAHEQHNISFCHSGTELEDWPPGLFGSSSPHRLQSQLESQAADLVDPMPPPAVTSGIFDDPTIADSFSLQLFPDPVFHDSADSPDSSSISSFLNSRSSDCTGNSDMSSNNDSNNSDPLLAMDQLSTFLQEDEVTHTTFADDHMLHVTELDLLRATAAIGRQLRSLDRLWDLAATSIFHPTRSEPCSSPQQPQPDDWALSLPANLRPTALQRSIPHPALIDVLPWPGVRDKLIAMWSLPSDAWPRHPADRGERCALVRLVYDMEGGGVRVCGAEPAAEEAWVVVSQDFVDAWWWALDVGVLRRGSRWRLERGLRPLVVGGREVGGEQD